MKRIYLLTIRPWSGGIDDEEVFSTEAASGAEAAAMFLNHPESEFPAYWEFMDTGEIIPSAERLLALADSRASIPDWNFRLDFLTPLRNPEAYAGLRALEVVEREMNRVFDGMDNLPPELTTARKAMRHAIFIAHRACGVPAQTPEQMEDIAPK